MSEALLEISAKGFGVTGVTDAGGRLAGIVTDGDLRRHMEGLLGPRRGRGDDAARPAPSAPTSSPRRRWA